MEEFEEKFIKPIVNASYPATLAVPSQNVLKIVSMNGTLTLHSFEKTTFSQLQQLSARSTDF